MQACCLKSVAQGLSVLVAPCHVRQGFWKWMAPVRTSNGACSATGGTWFDGVVATAIGTRDSAWHLRQSPDVSLGVVNFKSATATCSGAMADCVWQVVQSIPAGPAAPV